MINHKKGERKARERGHQPEKVAAEFRNKSICLTSEFWNKKQGYKYITNHYPFDVDDTQEIHERESDLLRYHP
jgi:glycine betaine/choline ABC-type transport system substrate-binding protein